MSDMPRALVVTLIAVAPGAAACLAVTASAAVPSPKDATGYGNAYVAAYKKLWGLK